MIIGSKDNFHFRTIGAKDEQKVRNIIFSILKDYNLPIDEQGVDADLFDIKNKYKDHLFVVVEDANNEIVGSFALYQLSKTELELRKMYLLKEYRNLGLGKWMVNYSIQYAIREGYSQLTLETASVLKEAELLYIHMGFKREKDANLTPRCNRVYKLELKK